MRIARAIAARLDRKVIAGAAIFISLNILDALFTKIAVSQGATELMPLAKMFGSSIIAKSLIAIAIVAALIAINKLRLLLILNVALGIIVAWGFAAAFLFPI
jgi:hypothetical protein